MQLSRGRVVLRVVLLTGGGAYMLWRAWQALGVARKLAPTDAGLERWIALVEALVGLLAVLTGLAALASLRRRPRRHTLHLP